MAAASVALVTNTIAPRRAANNAAEINSVWYLDYVPNSSYTTGGDTIDIVAALPNQVRSVWSVICIPKEAAVGWQATYDAPNKKISLWNGTTQFSNGSDASAKLFTLRVEAG